MTRPMFLNILTVLALAVPCFSSSPASDFYAPQFIALGGAAQAVAVADFNGDGQLDIVAATEFCCPSQINLSILMGRGHSKFGPPVSYSLASSPITLTVGDFNNDGHPDIAVGESNGLEIFLNRGDGTFLPSPVSYQFYYVSSVAVGDFNGDHNLDLAVTADANYSTSVTVMLGKGDGTFPSSVNYPAGNGPDAVTVADFNGDGKLDLAVSNGYYQGQFQNQFNLLLGNGDGSFQPPVAFATDDSPVAIAAGDLNGDGKIDVAVLNSDAVIPLPANTDVVDVFLNNGDGTFQPRTSYHADFGAASLIVTDLNRDGISDIAVCNAFDGDIMVLLSGGNGTKTMHFYQSYIASSFVGTNCMAAGDFTGSGQVDLVTSAQNGVAILHNKDAGNFNVASDYRTGTLAVDIGVGDFTGDGNLDLVTAHIGSGGFPSQLTVIPGKGDGSFRRAHHLKTQIRYAGVATHLAVGDFNNDGKLDVVVLLSTTNGEQNAVTVLLGKGDGTFEQGHTYSLPSGCWAGPIAVGDLNGDGFLDLVVVNSGCETVTVFLGKGNGAFNNIGTFGSGGQYGYQYQLGIAMGDFNNDGKLDLAVTNAREGGFPSIIGILLGKGNGTFQPVRTIADGTDNPYAVVVGDFNRDGNLDLAITNYDTSQVMVLPGRGDGTFGSPNYLSLSQPSRVLLAGDFNGDGKIDLVTIPEYEYVPLGVSVFHGNGDGTFQPPQNYPTGIDDVALAAGNFQGTSGGLDLAVLLGSTYDPLGAGVTVYLHPPAK
jgi:hypothetical protein